jgi:hypothetical protein
MRYWAGLYREATQEMINIGIDSVMKTGIELQTKSARRVGCEADQGQKE